MLSHVPDLDRRVDLAREILSTRRDDIDFESEPALASEIAALGLWREIGTANDQLTTRLIDADSGASVPVECARSELIDHRGNVGIRIWYDRHERLDVPSYFLRALFHPGLSFNPDGTLHQIVIFPITVARIARREDARLVIVPRWALDMPFAHPDSETWQYYRDFGKPERWAAVRDWVLHFCELTIDKKIPFFTTHDLSAHITGVQKAAWDMLGVVARKLKDCMDHVFAGCPDPPTQTLILPFMAGYLLDGLAQPVHGDNERMLIVIDSLLEAIAEPAIDPRAPGILRRFPQSYWKVLDHMRLAPVPPPASYRDEIRELIREVVVEIKHEVRAA